RPPPATLFPYTTLFRSGVDEITDTSLGYAILDSRPQQGSLAFAPPDTLQQQWETHAIDALTYRNDYVRFLRESYHRYREMWVALDRKSTRLNSSHVKIS